MGYRISVALAAMSLVLAVTGWILVPFSWESVKDASDDSLSFETMAWIGVFLVGPIVLPLALWRWSAAAARVLIPVLACLYCLWTVLWATSLIGLLFWPAGLVLLLASLIRAAVWLPGPHDRLVTQEEVLNPPM